MAVGALAGLMEGTITQGFALHYIFPGAVLTLCAAFIGGFSGFILKDTLRVIRGLKPYTGINNDGMMLGAMLFSLIGTLLQIAGSSNGANILVGSMCGAAIGAMIGAMCDEYVTPMLIMISKDNSPNSGLQFYQRIFASKNT